MSSTATILLSPRLTTLGPIVQLAYVPRHFDAAIDFWTHKLGVGPFFMVDRVAVDQLSCRGAPIALDFSLAFSLWGETVIELIRQNDRTPSIFRDWNSDSLHHIQVAVEDYAAAMTACRNAGLPLALEGHGIPGMPDFRFAFCELGEGAPAGFIELAHVPDASQQRALLNFVKEHVRAWDGRDPVRRL